MLELLKPIIIKGKLRDIGYQFEPTPQQEADYLKYGVAKKVAKKKEPKGK